jgi:hypothetical protein
MVTVDACQGIEDQISQVGLIIFPNPNNGKFTLEITGETNGQAQVSIANAAGEVVYTNKYAITRSGQRLALDLNIGSGVYFMKVETANGNLTRKLVIR